MAAAVANKSSECGDRCAIGPVDLQLPVKRVVVHPLVLLSVVDHFNRLAKIGSQRRVVGCLLGSWSKRGVLDVSNSFAVPFDEDERDHKVWFFDHDYLEIMFAMLKKVNAREKIVGWYHSGPKLHKNDVAINDLMRRYCPDSVLIIIDANPKPIGLPTEAYVAYEEVHDDGTPTSRTFEHVPSEIGAEEAEEVGVEHLLRDVKDTTAGTLSQRVTDQLLGLKGLLSQVRAIRAYLQQVLDDRLPVNHQIVYALQDVFNLLPDVTADRLTRSLYVQTNDQMLVVYLASVIRSVLALHNLIDNKLSNQEAERRDASSASSASASSAANKKDKQSDKDKEKEKNDDKKSDAKKKESSK